MLNGEKPELPAGGFAAGAHVSGTCEVLGGGPGNFKPPSTRRQCPTAQQGSVRSCLGAGAQIRLLRRRERGLPGQRPLGPRRA